jgi:hypothetical protein
MLASETGIATHELGNTLDLVFPNIPLLDTKVASHLHTTSGHDTLITVLPITTGPLAANPSYIPTIGPFVLNNDPELLAKYTSRMRWSLATSEISGDYSGLG